MRASQARRAVAVVSIALVALSAAGTRADAHPPAPTVLPPHVFDRMIAMCTIEPKGCEPRPAPRPKAPKVNRGSPRSHVQAPAGDDVWAALGRCENGGRLTSDPGDRYRGLFQFSPATWRSVGGTGDPADATYETQLALAQKLQARSGWGQWPRCSRLLGLR